MTLISLDSVKRLVELTVDGRDDPRRMPPPGSRDADALLRRHADAGERVPRLRG
jgi:hypothetical protein